MNADVEKAVKRLDSTALSLHKDWNTITQALRDQEAEIARLRARSEKDVAMLRKCRQFVAWATERLPEAMPVYDELNAHLGGDHG